MLELLRIENLALVETVEIEFRNGFTVLTGETGAGKSICVGALNLLAGGRAEKGIIRQGQESCCVQGIFSFQGHRLATIQSLLSENDLPLSTDGELLVQRVIHKSKASRAYINGSLASMSAIQELGRLWIEFHGPGEQQRLFNEDYQCQLLDAFAANSKDLAAYQAIYKEYQGIRQAIAELQSKEQISDDEQNFLKAQIEKIESACETVESIDELETSFESINNAGELRELSQRLAYGLRSNCRNALCEALSDARRLAELQPHASEIHNTLEDLVSQIDDLSSSAEQLSNSIDFEPSAIEAINAHMSRWLEVRRQYGPSPEQVIAKRDAFAKKLALQSDIAGSIAKLESEAAEKAKDLKAKSKALRKTREGAAQTLSAAVLERLAKLGFASVHFSVDLVDRKDFGPRGDHGVSFIFGANKGHSAGPLNKVASSGELARVLLAIKSALAQVDATAVLVFDEVDANVGGEVGAQVGRLLRDLGAGHQVICITHLPQVASQGESHLRIRKHEANASMRVEIEDITTETLVRTEEIARMLGNRSSDVARGHARELLAH